MGFSDLEILFLLLGKEFRKGTYPRKARGLKRAPLKGGTEKSPRALRVLGYYKNKTPCSDNATRGSLYQFPITLKLVIHTNGDKKR